MIMNLLTFLQRNENSRKIFGKRELKIIEKQLNGINLTQSEKNRLSRDIRKKFEFIKEIASYENEFELKKGANLKPIIKEVLEEILNHPLREKVQEIWLFGSTVDNQRTFRSDIDIAVIFDDISITEATKFRIRVAGGVSVQVDIQVFNILPQKVKESIIQKHKVLYRKDERR